MVSKTDEYVKGIALDGAPPPGTNQELFDLARSYLGQSREALNRLLQLPGPTGERLRRIEMLRAKRREYEELFERLKTRNTTQAREQLGEIERDLMSQRERLESQKDQARKLAPLTKSDESVLRPLEEARAEIEKIQGNLIPDLEKKKLTKEGEIERTFQADMSVAPDAEAVKALNDVAKFVSNVGGFEIEQHRGIAIDEGVKNDFAEKSIEFKEASEHHRRQANYMLVVMGGVVGVGAIVIYWLFGDVRMECVGPYSGRIETLAIIERLVLAGVGRIAVLALIAWSLAYTGSLHRSHSEQAVMYHDKKAALGVINNLVRAATDLPQKHDLLQSIARGYLGFDQNAFRISHNSHRDRRSRGPSAAGQIKELADAASPLVDVLSKLRKE